MKHHLRSNQIKLGSIAKKRPGIAQSFMIPQKMKHQLRIGAKTTDLDFSQAGKTLVGGVQWAIAVQRPGIATPLIQAKKEQQALAKGLAMRAKYKKPHGTVVAKMQAAKTQATTVDGYWL